MQVRFAFVALGLTVPALVVAAVQAPASALTTQQLGIVDQNVHRDPSALASAVDKAETEGAQVILLQEVCKSHLDSLIGTNGATKGWTVAFKQDQTNCPGTENGGVAAIWTGGTTGSKTTMTFSADTQYVYETDPDPTDAYTSTATGMACVLFQSEYRACSVHIVINGGYEKQRAQVAEIEPWMQNPAQNRYWISTDKRIILGGDFNMTPDRPAMDKIYKNPTSSSVGYFHEAYRTQQPAGSVNVCRCGSATANDATVKFDYVFISSNVFSNTAQSSLSLSTNASDHKLLYAASSINF
ncbi:endonuclease/exonuclease/phosphatase family protein [Nocardioides rubriscoriae]|uniref:endonuclease/exonuclease/phosphatase family protein n=1 Tax=Nocardioides rubriscoriae TaxID=642762 RepID=UPI001FECE609|nr:endonuclease/exonuclease/phosphatase family protein [Nocardioides rubriscoriae]